MAYNNYGGGYSNNRGYPQRYSNSGYNSGGFNQSRGQYANGGNYGQVQQYGQAPKKHSGCTWRENFMSKSGKQKAAVMFGWNYSRQRGGLMKFVATPAKDTTVNNRTGKNLSKWVAKIQWANGQSEVMTAFLNRDTKKLTIPNLSMVANPNVPNGGYFGRAFRK